MPDARSSTDCEIIIRRATVADIPAILKVTESSTASARWPSAAYPAYCISDVEPGETLAKALFVAVENKRLSRAVLGLAAFSTVLGSGESELENMVVEPEWRRRGVGRRLLQAGMQWCCAWGFATGDTTVDATPAALWLEVRASNAGAIAFYEHAGFAVNGSRPAYYTHPVEDAVRMRRVYGVSARPC